MSSFIDMFTNMKTVLCVCPNCSKLMRLSDLHLRSDGKAEMTWLDKHDSKVSTFEKKEQKFDEEEEEIREKSRSRGRSKVPALIRKSMDEKFAKLKYDPYDIKALLHPIDFVVFDGMNKDKMKNVVLMSKGTTNPNLLQLHQGIAHAVGDEAYDWKVVRVSEDGQVEYE